MYTVGEILSRLREGPDRVRAIARQAAGRCRLEIDQWTVRPLDYRATNPNSGGLFRIAGAGRDGDACLAWSAVLKILSARTGQNAARFPRDWGESPSHYSYWKREALAYESGLLGELRGGLSAPRCFAVDQESSDAVWLWLEDLEDLERGAWSLEKYGAVARDVGRFNGAYLAAQALPSHFWLSRAWLRGWLACVERTTFADLERLLTKSQVWEHELVREVFPPPFARRLAQLCDDREKLLGALEQLPQTLCHFDLHRSNVFSGTMQGRENRTVAIDWAFVGIGAIGEEIAQLVTAALLFGALPSQAACRLDEVAFAGYVAGLRDAGWQGDVRAARFGFASSAALRWGFSVRDTIRFASNSRHASCDARTRTRALKLIRDRAAIAQFLLDRADEARSLLAEL